MIFFKTNSHTDSFISWPYFSIQNYSLYLTIGKDKSINSVTYIEFDSEYLILTVSMLYGDKKDLEASSCFLPDITKASKGVRSRKPNHMI